MFPSDHTKGHAIIIINEAGQLFLKDERLSIGSVIFKKYQLKKPHRSFIYYAMSMPIFMCKQNDAVLFESLWMKISFPEEGSTESCQTESQGFIKLSYISTQLLRKVTPKSCLGNTDSIKL